MQIPKSSLVPIDFDGLKIFDYTATTETSSSVAEITIPPGVRHRKAYSKKSDKYYYVVFGGVDFNIEGEAYQLAAGDVCVILKGQKFSYQNTSDEPSKMILVHTPTFDLQCEVFEE